MHMIARNKWGVPQNSRDSFELLHKYQIIDASLLKKLKAMIGFRNIAVHNYQSLDMSILQQVIENNLGDLILFTNTIVSYLQ